MLCYGFVALFSPPSLIISRMEATILRSLTPHFANVKVGDNVILCLLIKPLTNIHVDKCCREVVFAVFQQSFFVRSRVDLS